MARDLATKAKRNGALTRLPCRDCGAKKSEMHHPDYSKPLDVVWLCKPCHDAEHRRLGKELAWGAKNRRGLQPAIVRIPGFTRGELRLIDRAATLKGWSRAQWLRAVAVEAARQPSQAIPSTAKANAVLGPIPPHPVINGPLKPIGRGLKPGEHRPAWAPASEADGPVRQDD